MKRNTSKIRNEERPKQGQSVPLGDTGDGETGVPADEQGISNREGDRQGCQQEKGRRSAGQKIQQVDCDDIKRDAGICLAPNGIGGTNAG